MLLLAESGATKTEWRLLKAGQVLATYTGPGYNLHVMRPQAVHQQLAADWPHLNAHGTPKGIVFYGASLSQSGLRQQMADSLYHTSGLALEAIEVHHDLLAAARAGLGDHAGLVGILGTGSSAAAYDGSSITAMAGGHGYLFGDEGAGADLGRRLVKALLDGTPGLEALQSAFEQQFAKPLTFRNQVYAAPKPNVLLASLAPFVHAHAHVPAVQAIVREAFEAYLHTSIRPLTKGTAPVAQIALIGSIAEAFQPLLAELFAPLTGSLSILGQPIDALTAYHLRHDAP